MTAQLAGSPPMARGRRVVSLDLSGHGESSHAAGYDHDQWALEVLEAARAGQVLGPPVPVGHSMGGVVCLRAASRPGAARAVVVVDSAVRDYSDEEMASFRRYAARGPRRYPTLAEAVRHFRLLPGADLAPPYLLERLAERATGPWCGGWAWRFDPVTLRQKTMTPAGLRPVGCPVALVRGDCGTMPPEVCDTIRAGIGQHSAVHVIADAGHHVMIEQPAALLDRLLSVVGRWEAPVESGRVSRERP
jgi:pimeloyl-ACP methyl ester carboxylesterase